MWFRYLVCVPSHSYASSPTTQSVVLYVFFSGQNSNRTPCLHQLLTRQKSFDFEATFRHLFLPAMELHGVQPTNQTSHETICKLLRLLKNYQDASFIEKE